MLFDGAYDLHRFSPRQRVDVAKQSGFVHFGLAAEPVTSVFGNAFASSSARPTSSAVDSLSSGSGSGFGVVGIVFSLSRRSNRRAIESSRTHSSYGTGSSMSS